MTSNVLHSENYFANNSVQIWNMRLHKVFIQYIIQLAYVSLVLGISSSMSLSVLPRIIEITFSKFLFAITDT